MKTIIAVAILFFSSTLYADTAKELNTQGFRLYKQQRYVEALALFKKATIANPKYALGFYNTASTLGVLHKKSVCEYDAYKSTINKYLKIAVQLDPKRAMRMQTDSDLEPVHDTFIYQRLLGLRLNKTADVRKILQRVTWYGPSMGVIGPVSHIAFKEKGKVILALRTLNDQGVETKEEVAHYKLNSRKITIYRKPMNGKIITIHGQLTPQGELHFDDNMPEMMRRFSDDPDNCSA